MGPQLEAAPPDRDQVFPILNPGSLAIQGWPEEDQTWPGEDTVRDPMGPQTIEDVLNMDPEREIDR